MKSIILFLTLISLTSCSLTEAIRYDSNSDRYKRQHGIQRKPAVTHSGPNCGSYYKKK